MKRHLTLFCVMLAACTATAGKLDSFEAGFGPVGMHARHTIHDEENPDDELELINWHLLYRMSLGPYVEIDLGVGALRF